MADDEGDYSFEEDPADPQDAAADTPEADEPAAGPAEDAPEADNSAADPATDTPEDDASASGPAEESTQDAAPSEEGGEPGGQGAEPTPEDTGSANQGSPTETGSPSPDDPSTAGTDGDERESGVEGSSVGGGGTQEAEGRGNNSNTASEGGGAATEAGRESPPAPEPEALPTSQSSQQMSTDEARALAMELLNESNPKGENTILSQVAKQQSRGGAWESSADGGSQQTRTGRGTAGSAGTGTSGGGLEQACNVAAGPTEPQPPPGPGYLGSTCVLPKGAHQGYKNADKEHIENVWSTGTTLSRGIRSLPNAMSPDYRIRLYDEIIEGAKREKNGQGPMNRALGLAYGNEAGPAAYQLAAGQRVVPKEHPYAGSFSTFEHLPSEYDRQQLILKFERLKKKLAQIHPVDFVVKAAPAGPKSAPAFSEYDYPSNPYEGTDANLRAEDTTQKARVVSGAFHAGGKLTTAAALRGLANESMMWLCKQLSVDWPTAFLQTFEDRSGSIVISFDKAEALSQGDLGMYMNNLAKNNREITVFRLMKDASQWGLIDGETQTIFYVLWPPWVRHRFFGSPAAEHVAQAAEQEA